MERLENAGNENKNSLKSAPKKQETDKNVTNQKPNVFAALQVSINYNCTFLLILLDSSLNNVLNISSIINMSTLFSVEVS